ncbi:DNA-directed RNA polymerase II subunit RPB1-like [Prorops nasuta]|uniref:DNA-directed RNA polymerase II subunit RPB1-like n=1 Tax=Prorops nasuta TaxID=863751 RepID=UPI0034CE3752
MKRIFLCFTLLVLGASAARRFRSTTAAATTTTVQQEVHQPEAGELAWDQVDSEKISSTNSLRGWGEKVAEAKVSEGLQENVLNYGEARQYPGSPGGGTGEVPRPILPPVSPPPALPPGCLAPRGQFPSSTSCSNYVNCWDDTAIEQTCPNGLLFNDLTGFCDFDYNVNCGSRPAPTPKPPLQPDSKYCPELNGRYRSSSNCSEFYVCLVGKPIKFSCPRGLVYNDELSVCDFVYNVDCQGAATPAPTTAAPWTETKPSARPTRPNYTPQQPSHSSQQPSYPSQQPSYPSQQPSYPSQPTAYPSAQPSYPENVWSIKQQTDPWHQRPAASQFDLERDGQLNNPNPTGLEDEAVGQTLPNPWSTAHTIPADLNSAPCKNGDVHRLDDTCANVVVCRNQRPKLVQCPTGLTYDKPSDSCKHFTIAKC